MTALVIVGAIVAYLAVGVAFIRWIVYPLFWQGEDDFTCGLGVLVWPGVAMFGALMGVAIGIGWLLKWTIGGAAVALGWLARRRS